MSSEFERTDKHALKNLTKPNQGHSHSGSAGCAHHHLVHSSQRTIKNITWAFAVNICFAVIELVGGYWTQSTAIQADAIHDLGDAAALAAALLLQIISAIPPRSGYSYGLRRFSLLSALMTSILLMIGSVYVFLQAVQKFYNPVTPHLNGMLGLAILGVAVNGFAAWKMSRGKTQSEKAMAWHMLEDLFGWIAVLVSSFVMRFWELPWLDPLLAIFIAAVVLFGAGRAMVASIKLFLQAVPHGISEELLRVRILKVPGVAGIRALHIWSLDGENHVGSIRIDVKTEEPHLNWNELRRNITEAVQEFGAIDLTIEPYFSIDKS